MPDCGIRPSGVVIGKAGDTRFNRVSLFHGHSAFISAEPEKLPKKVAKRVLRGGGNCAIMAAYIFWADSAPA